MSFDDLPLTYLVSECKPFTLFSHSKDICQRNHILFVGLSKCHGVVCENKYSLGVMIPLPKHSNHAICDWWGVCQHEPWHEKLVQTRSSSVPRCTCDLWSTCVCVCHAVKSSPLCDNVNISSFLWYRRSSSLPLSCPTCLQANDLDTNEHDVHIH